MNLWKDGVWRLTMKKEKNFNPKNFNILQDIVVYIKDTGNVYSFGSASAVSGEGSAVSLGTGGAYAENGVAIVCCGTVNFSSCSYPLLLGKGKEQVGHGNFPINEDIEVKGVFVVAVGMDLSTEDGLVDRVTPRVVTTITSNNSGIDLTNGNSILARGAVLDPRHGIITRWDENSTYDEEPIIEKWGKYRIDYVAHDRSFVGDLLSLLNMRKYDGDDENTAKFHEEDV